MSNSVVVEFERKTNSDGYSQFDESGSCTIPLTANDYVEVFVYHDEGSALQLYDAPSRTLFSGFRVA